jgi:RND family efflux transporter MFP subunit
VARPVQREVLEWDEYTARLEATETVEVRARVNGYLQSIHFKDGSIVKKGELLFTIDPRPYEATLRRAEGEHAVSKARLELAEKKLQRAANLIGRDAISKEEADIRAAEARQAEAAVAASSAAVESARLEVEFTQIHSPIEGRVGRKLVTEGNLVNGGIGALGTLLTTIVSLDPIHAYFDADERSYLKYARLAKSGLRPSSREHQNPVRIQLADERGFPHEGYMDFVDNQFDKGTGTMVGRALIPNPDLLLAPGLFARLQLPGSGKYQAVLVPDAAILFDQSESFVWILDEKNLVEYRRVQIGRLHEGLRIIREGLEPNDRVIVAGIQRVRPGIEVLPEEAPISTGAQGSDAAQKTQAPVTGATKPPGGESPKE